MRKRDKEKRKGPVTLSVAATELGGGLLESAPPAAGKPEATTGTVTEGTEAIWRGQRGG